MCVCVCVCVICIHVSHTHSVIQSTVHKSDCVMVSFYKRELNMNTYCSFNSYTSFLLTLGFLHLLEGWDPWTCVLNKLSRWLWWPNIGKSRVLCHILKTRYSQQAVNGFMADTQGDGCTGVESQTAIVWMFVSYQNSYVEILTLKAMVLGGGVFGCQLGHECDLREWD